MTTLKLEVGKSYRTRDGERVKVDAIDKGGDYRCIHINERTLFHYEDGKCPGFPYRDLISEWQDEPEKEKTRYIMDKHGNISVLGQITVRDYFAGCALQGILAGDTEGGLDPDQAAEIVMSMANALMKARGE